MYGENEEISLEEMSNDVSEWIREAERDDDVLQYEHVTTRLREDYELLATEADVLYTMVRGAEEYDPETVLEEFEEGLAAEPGVETEYIRQTRRALAR